MTDPRLTRHALAPPLPGRRPVTAGQSSDDGTLIAAAKDGDALAMRLLYERYATRVYAVIRRIAPDPSIADDWAQETWARAFRALPRFRGESSFGTWILRIAMKNCGR